MSVLVFFVDAFTSERFKGNPTAVCYSIHPIDEKQMQLIAKEFNLPVTAFVNENNKDFLLRYFTPFVEIPACGHATLAAAVVMAGIKAKAELIFNTAANIKIHAGVENGNACLSYPKYKMEEFIPSQEMLQSLQIHSFANAGFCGELETVFIEMNSAEDLKAIQPDFKRLMTVNTQIKEVVITSPGDNSSYDYVLRSFCPWIGIDEDPVTGSVHSVLAPYWAKKLGKTHLNAWQASERNGEFILSVENDVVLIKGNCIFIMKGELMF